ncbi:948_t:CDS:2 [Dentiscutata erythropus]|uniref:948_t:CDS:1 n=1 Tax=Dentiscutata erythropus TaxID=1348616 RepID=A0A9N9BWP3_9GLOM|nr:948_t:CDS:2 [Dentiscutata erythropus]
MSMALTESHIKTTFPTFKREQSLLIKLINYEIISYKTNKPNILDKIYNDLIQQTRELLDENFYKYIKEDSDKPITDSIIPEWIGLLACIEFIRARIFLKLISDPSLTFEKIFTLTYSDDDEKSFIITIPGDESLPSENNVERKVNQNTVKIYMEFVIIAMNYLTILREGKDFSKEKTAYYSFGDVLDDLQEPTSPSFREICLKSIINLIKTEITDVEIV